MLRPSSAAADVPRDAFVDAGAHARAESRISRRFSGAELPRLSEAGLPIGSQVEAWFQFALFDGRPVIDGAVCGRLELICQRCMRPVTLEVDEPLKVMVLQEEFDQEPGGYEPVISDPARLDLRWLVEEQMLLALPLVPMHEHEDCVSAGGMPLVAVLPQDEAPGETQMPFHNLRDLLRRQ
ncbi:hypothetical protein ACG33_09235 [Steroidobacter denitrificans]|uniref:Large ribosomal RNA subunit accumulation protein YceD n=1 Tax=Steroidobacter denitrificans TaxID=465721 RepID=A0A127FA31_STEDE|nr:YceD family protein [Steroidobacter denitrificans]AMN47274.1 hypothetical protein ACG33_09235 [Steroidobacter denitrificans]